MKETEVSREMEEAIEANMVKIEREAVPGLATSFKPLMAASCITCSITVYVMHLIY